MKSLFLFVALLASASLAGAADCGCASCPGACDCGCQFVAAKDAPGGLVERHINGTCYLLTPAQAKDAELIAILAKLPPVGHATSACPGGFCAPAPGAGNIREAMFQPRYTIPTGAYSVGGFSTGPNSCPGGQCGAPARGFFRR